MKKEYEKVYSEILNLKDRDYKSVDSVLKRCNIIRNYDRNLNYSEEIHNMYCQSASNLKLLFFDIIYSKLQNEERINDKYLDGKEVSLNYDIPLNSLLFGNILRNRRRLYIYYKDNSKDDNKYYNIEYHKFVTCDGINYYDDGYELNTRNYNKKYRIYREFELDDYLRIKYFRVLNKNYNYDSLLGIYLANLHYCHTTISDIIEILSKKDYNLYYHYIRFLDRGSNSWTGTYLKINDIIYIKNYNYDVIAYKCK